MLRGYEALAAEAVVELVEAERQSGRATVRTTVTPGHLSPLAQELVDLSVPEGVAEADGGAAGQVSGQVVQETLTRLLPVLSGEVAEEVL